MDTPGSDGALRKPIGFGSKTIGFLGSFALLFNGMTGAGQVVLPLAFQSTGWLLCAALIVGLGALSALCSEMLAEAMASIPGNENFQGRIEFTHLARRYMSRRGYLITFSLLLLMLVSANVSNIIASGQVVDSAMSAAGDACALEFYPNPGFRCVKESQTAATDSVFGNAYVLSAGFLTNLVVAIPLGLINLDDNIAVQLGSALGLFIIVALWAAYFVSKGLDHERIAVASPSMAGIGYIFVQYDFVVLVPSWINEKEPGVNVRKCIWLATLACIGVFLAIGLFGALADDYSSGEDILGKLTGKGVATYARVVAYLFPTVALLSDIPVLSIIMRYNLLENKVCSRGWANFWSVVLPWLIALVFYGGDLINYVLEWLGLLTTTPLCFLAPMYMFYMARFTRAAQAGPSIYEKNTGGNQPSLVPSHVGQEAAMAPDRAPDLAADPESISLALSQGQRLRRRTNQAADEKDIDDDDETAPLTGASPRRNLGVPLYSALPRDVSEPAVRYALIGVATAVTLLMLYSMASTLASDTGNKFD